MEKRTVATATGLLALVATLSCAGQRSEKPVPDPGVGPLIAAAERAAEAGDFASAIAAYSEALEKTPWNERITSPLVSARVAHAAQLRSAGNGVAGIRAAVAQLRKALAASPDNATVKRNLAIVLAEHAAYEPDGARAAAMREEAAALDADVTAMLPVVRLGVERRLDLAVEEIERGQLDAGLDRLTRLRSQYADRDDIALLLAQARVRKGLALSERRNWDAAADQLDRAIEIYASLAPCDGTRCTAAGMKAAHHNRIVNWLSADRYAEASAALAAARAAGLDFPELAAAIDKGADW